MAFPTETVYGLGANALNREAVLSIFAAKGRPADNPLIVHVWNRAQLDDLCEVTPMARRLMDAFWPGPLTILMEKKEAVPPEVTAGLPTVAVRMPSHPVAAAMLKACNLPIAAPSANRSGKPSPTTARHVLEDMDGRIPLILDGGSCEVGLESTVLDICHGKPCILRPGGVTRAMLESVLGKVGRAIAGTSTGDDDVLDNLEEALITSDVGVETTLRIIERIQERVKRDKYLGTSELNTILVE